MTGASADRPRAIVHVDMDAFYASVEQRDDPALRGLPVIVGGHPQRGVVTAASYEVRKYGVRSAMPMARALRLCPDAVVVRPRFDAYVSVSERLHEIFESYTPLVEPLSLDEAFLDVTASYALHGDGAAIARAVRARIADELRLPASAGIAPVKFAAKIASDHAKPNGQFEIAPDAVQAFLAPLPVARLWGVGAVTETRLHALGLKCVGDIARLGERDARTLLGERGMHLWQLAHGIDARPVVPDREAKSIGAEDTFDEDVETVEGLRVHLLSQAMRVGRRLRRAGKLARVVVLKLKDDEFRLVTRRLTLRAPTDDGAEMYRHAMALLERETLARPVRLSGVSAHDLDAPDTQLGLFAAPKRDRALNTTLDAIHARFGPRALLPADLASETAGATRSPRGIAKGRKRGE